jgi:hypothetical protein
MALAVSRRKAGIPGLTEHRYWLESTRDQVLGPGTPQALAATNELLALLGEPNLRYSKNVVGLFRILVAVRNATRAHGAPLASDYRQLNPRLALVLDSLLAHDFTLEGQLLFPLESPLQDACECLVLLGGAPRKRRSLQLPPLAGTSLWYQYPGTSDPHALAPLLQFEPSTLAFFFANGTLNDTGEAPFLNYASGRKGTYSLSAFLGIPVDRPASSTAGLTTLVLSERVGHNLPPKPVDYVARPALESLLRGYLTDRRNRLITLHGPGGAGKTSLALATLYDLIDSDQDLPFDFIIWCSARDVDLLEGSPRLTRREISDLDSIANLFCTVTESSVDESRRVAALASALEGSTPRYLVVLDNFETVDNATAVFGFFNDHVTLPNRTIITAREHETTGDQVLPVVRMELREADQLLRYEAQARGIESYLDATIINRIHEACAGNPYAMKLVVARFALTRNLEQILRETFGRADLQQALCQRAFAELDEWDGYLFLLLGQLRFDPLESMLHISAAKHHFDLAVARRSLLERSLAEVAVTASGENVLMMPDLHQAFARQQLIGDRRAPIVIDDAAFLSQYAPTLRDPKTASLFTRLGDDMVAAHRAGRMDDYAGLLTGLSALAAAEPQYLAEEARYLQLAGEDADRVKSAFKRAVEWQADDPSVWVAWANYERDRGDRLAELQVLANSATSIRDDVRLNLIVAARIADAFRDVRPAIAQEERGPYLRSCRDNLQRHQTELNGTGLSRLGWLHVLDGNVQATRDLIEQGLKGEPKNPHLLKLRQTVGT